MEPADGAPFPAETQKQADGMEYYWRGSRMLMNISRESICSSFWPSLHTTEP